MSTADARGTMLNELLDAVLEIERANLPPEDSVRHFVAWTLSVGESLRAIGMTSEADVWEAAAIRTPPLSASFTTQGEISELVVHLKRMKALLIGMASRLDPFKDGPWWMSRAEQNSKWERLGSASRFAKDRKIAAQDSTGHSPLALLFIDFDDLKQLNTAHGNTEADRSLGAVITTICDVCQGKGRAYLHGHGDEFAVLLPNTSAEEALATAERIVRSCQTLKLERLPSPTVSVGVAVMPGDATDEDGLQRAAERAQLDAKQQGKNRAFRVPPTTRN